MQDFYDEVGVALCPLLIGETSGFIGATCSGIINQ